MRIIFPFIGEPHHIFHALPIAAEMAAMGADVEVAVAGPEGCGPKRPEQHMLALGQVAEAGVVVRPVSVLRHGELLGLSRPYCYCE